MLRSVNIESIANMLFHMNLLVSHLNSSVVFLTNDEYFEDNMCPHKVIETFFHKW